MNNPGGGEWGSLLKQAQQMQRELDRVREELRQRTVEGSAGGGAIKVVVTGDRQIAKVHIADDLVAENDRALLEDLMLAALRDGLAKAQRMAEEALGKVAGGVQLPGLF